MCVHIVYFVYCIYITILSGSFFVYLVDNVVERDTGAEGKVEGGCCMCNDYLLSDSKIE